MQNFSAVQSIIRAGLAGDPEIVAKQARRLRDRLAKEGDDKSVMAIDRLLAAQETAATLKPSRVEPSRAVLFGERLTQDVNPPIDRETGARLCEVSFESVKTITAPVYASQVAAGINGLLAEWAEPGALEKMGLVPTRTVLIFGPPGSGKTLTARHIAARMELPLVTARIDGLISSFLGTTARNIANLFEFANRYACILLLDEFDALAKLRDDPQEIGEIKRVVNSLLQNLDFRKSFGMTIAITNHDRLLDPAVWRRFETQIHMDAPQGDARERMLERFMAPVKLEPALANLIAYALSGYSGADLERLCASVKRAAALADAPFEARDWLNAFYQVLSRLPRHETREAMMLAQGVEAFAAFAARDRHLDVKQGDIARLAGLSASKLSRLKSDLPEEVTGDAHGQ